MYFYNNIIRITAFHKILQAKYKLIRSNARGILTTTYKAVCSKNQYIFSICYEIIIMY